MMNDKENFNNIIVLLDAGHGANDNTAGKHSPKLDPVEFDMDDGTVYGGVFREGNYNRILVDILYDMLKTIGIRTYKIVPEDKDVSLADRVKRVNNICIAEKDKTVLLISVHGNAAGSGGWHNARGTSVHVCRGCSDKSKKLARSIMSAAVNNGYRGNRSIPDAGVWYNDFYIVKRTLCPAVLVENLFYDNKDDLALMMNENERKNIARNIYVGLINFLHTI